MEYLNSRFEIPVPEDACDPPIVTLCGSTRFKDMFLAAARELTLQGWIVLMPCVFGHSDNLNLSTKEKQNLDQLHLEKIRISDAILVLNYGGYIWESTTNEIAYACKYDIPIYFYE